MRFKSFHAENFITFPNIDLEFEGQGLTLVDGWNHDQGQANGAGKSVLLQSIAFAVYGKPVTEINLQDLLPEWSGTLKTDILLETTVGVVRIIRTRKPNTVRLLIGENEFKGTADSVEKRIVEVVGLSFEQFLQVAYFHQGARDRFVDVNDTAKKSFLASVLGLDKCEIAYSKAHEQLSVASGKVTKLEGSIATLEGVVVNQKAAVDRAGDALKAFAKGKPSTIATIQAKYATDPKKLALESALRSAENAYLATNAAVMQIPASLPDRQKLLDQQELSVKAGNLLAQTRSEYEAAERELKNARREREKLGTSSSPKNCYACGQALPVDPGIHKRIHSEIEAKESEIKALETKVTELTGKLGKVELLVRKTGDAARQIRDLDAQLSQHQSLRNQLEHRRRDVEAAKEALNNASALENERLKAMENEIKAIEAREVALTESYMNAELELHKLKDQLDEEKRKLSMAKEEVAYLQETKRVFSPTGLRAHVVDGVVSELNERITHYLSELFSDKVQFHYDIGESGKLISKLFFAGRERSSLATLSGGQRQRVRLAVDLALSDVVSNRLAVKPNVLFLDEVTDGLDSIGREGLMSILTELERNRDAIFVSDHESEFKSRFSKSIWLELKAGQTTISHGV